MKSSIIFTNYKENILTEKNFLTIQNIIQFKTIFLYYSYLQVLKFLKLSYVRKKLVCLKT